MATKEFTAHDGTTKLTPEAVNYNGSKGYIWTLRELENGAWVYKDQTFLRKNATRAQVLQAFDLVVQD